MIIKMHVYVEHAAQIEKYGKFNKVYCITSNYPEMFTNKMYLMSLEIYMTHAWIFNNSLNV